MPATEVTQNFFEAKPLWVGKVGAAGVASAVATTIPAQSAANLTNGNAYIVTVNRTDATGTVKHPANERETFIGKLSGTNFINCTRQVEGEAQAWEADTVLEILMTAEQWNKLIEGIEAEHGSDGKHKIDKLDAVRYAADAGGDDAYEITLAPAPTSYYAGMVVIFKATTANTGACTLDVNALGAKDIKKFGPSGVVALNDNDIQAAQIVCVIYDGTQFILIGNPGLLTGTNIINPTIVNPVINKHTGAITADTDGATITMDMSVSRHQVVLGGNRILAFTNISTGQVTRVDLIQDGTGTRTVTWPSFGAVATMTIATPCVVTTNKDIPTLTPVIFTTTGALPTGITAGTVYYYVRINATTGYLSTSVANAQAGTYITTSGSQSGVHTCAVQVRWPSQTAPTLSTGKFVKDKLNFEVIDATNTIVEGMVAGAGF